MSDRRRQGIVQPQLQEHAGGDFGESGAASPCFGLAQRAVILRGVGHAVLGAIQRGQSPTAPVSLGVSPPLSQRPKHSLHQVGKDLPRQPGSAIRTGAVAERILKERRKMFCKRADLIHDMKD